MRTSLFLLACAAALFAAAGCSDDNTCAPCAPAASDTPLAEFTTGGGGGLQVDIGDTLRISFVSSSADTLFDVFVTRADSATVRTITTRTFPPLAGAAARLSNDVDDQWTYRVTSVKYGWLSSTSYSESRWLNGGYTGAYTPDLHDAKITKAYIYLNEISIAPGPGYSTYFIGFRVVLMGKA
jgi:hypothetical protein